MSWTGSVNEDETVETVKVLEAFGFTMQKVFLSEHWNKFEFWLFCVIVFAVHIHHNWISPNYCSEVVLQLI